MTTVAIPRLLLDQNLSPRLVESLADIYPGICHVRELSLQRASDSEIWRIAASEGLAVTSKDSDFHRRAAQVHRFLLDEEAAFLTLR